MKFKCLYVRDNGVDQEAKFVPAPDHADRSVWLGEKSGIVFLHSISKDVKFVPGDVYIVTVTPEVAAAPEVAVPIQPLPPVV